MEKTPTESLENKTPQCQGSPNVVICKALRTVNNKVLEATI